MDELITRLVKAYGYNEPILTDDILAAWGEFSRARVFQLLKDALKKNRLVKYAFGVYYAPTVTFFGTQSALSFRKIIEKKYIRDGDGVFGYYSGMTFKNSLGLTMQMPNTPEVVSSKASAKFRMITIGNRSVIVRRARMQVTKNNAASLQLLELFNDGGGLFDKEKLGNIQEFVRQKGLTPKGVLTFANVFPAKAIQNLVSVGVENVFA
ncbi:hypothetical protein FACS1894211_09540 [Clostridia bacterium]|nr:hypothetical protein FACS1894211_09540 [Clostridia bacterium]